MHHDRRSGSLLQFAQAAYVVDVRMSADNCAHGERMARERFEDALDLVAWIEHQGFARFGITQNRAIALQPSDRQISWIMRGVRRALGATMAQL